MVFFGSLDDGTVGLAAVQDAGGLTVVRDPEGRRSRGYPMSAISYAKPAHIATLDEIPSILVRFVEEVPTVPDLTEPEGADGAVPTPTASARAHLPRMRRDLVARGGAAGAVPLPGRPHLLERERHARQAGLRSGSRRSIAGAGPSRAKCGFPLLRDDGEVIGVIVVTEGVQA